MTLYVECGGGGHSLGFPLPATKSRQPPPAQPQSTTRAHDSCGKAREEDQEAEAVQASALAGVTAAKAEAELLRAEKETAQRLAEAASAEARDAKEAVRAVAVAAETEAARLTEVRRPSSRAAGQP